MSFRTFGVTLEVWDDSSTQDWVTVGDLLDITPPNKEATDPLDKTTHGATGGVQVLEASGMFKWSDCPARMLNTPADSGQVLLQAARVSGVRTYFRVTKTSTPTLPVYFAGEVTQFADSEQPLSGLDEKNLVIKPSGDWPTRIISYNPALLNGGFETAGVGGGDIFADWEPEGAEAGTSSANRDTSVFRSGVASCRLDIDASDNYFYIALTSMTVGKNYRLSFWAKKTGATATLDVYDMVSAVIKNCALTTSWAYYAVDFEATATSFALKSADNSASQSIWIDDVTLTCLTPP